MSEKLLVEISGDAKDLQKEVAKAKKYIDEFASRVNSKVGGTSNPLSKAGESVSGFAKKTANATPSLLEFNRVIQDAPFGIQGVANNLTQLTTNFGYLKQSTGSTGAALKAMLSGLTGPAGILFAVSAVTSLLVVFQNKLGNTKSEAEKLAEATKKAAEKLESYADSLEQVSRARLRGEQSAQKELLTLSQLANAAEDTTRSTQDRAKAVQELRRLYPDYFKDLKDEEILTGDLKGVYDKLTDSILKRARATAATNQIVKNSEKQLVIESQLAAKTFEKQEAEKEAIRLEKAAADASSKNIKGVETLITRAIKSRSKVNDLIKEQTSLLGQQQNLELSNIDLSQLIDTSGGVDLSDVKIKEGKAVKIPVVADLDFSINREGDTVTRDLIGTELATAADKIYQYTDEVQLALENFNTTSSALIQGTISDTFGRLGQGIGEALATGGDVLGAVGNTLLSGLGGFLSKMGSLLIEYGTLAVLKGKLDIAILTGGPVAIGAGLAAIAVGVALSAAGAALGSAANGGANSGGSTSRGGSSSSTSFTSGSGGGFDGGRVVFEISGQKLIGVLDRTRSRNLAIGG